MRLVCPNCDAEYEVDDAAIPKSGRDVQCSNCGHGWFQVHADLEHGPDHDHDDMADAEAGTVAETAAMAQPAPMSDPDATPDAAPDAAPDDAATSGADTGGSPAPAMPPPLPDDLLVPAPDLPAGIAPDDAVLPQAAPAVTTAAAEFTAAITAPDPVDDAKTPPPRPALPPNNLDESVLNMLREEAAREVEARKSERNAAPQLETQTEMGLDAENPVRAAGGLAAAALRRVGRLGGGEEPEPALAAPRTRRDMLPAIEEINSTLRPSTEPRGKDDGSIAETMTEEPAAAARAGFGRGFLTLVLLVVVLLALYVFAPLIAAKVPALAGAMAAYVAAVDGARVWLDSKLKALVATLRGFAGGQGG